MKRILTSLLAIFLMAAPAYASIPDSIIIGNKAYDLRYLFTTSNSDEIKAALRDCPNNVLYKLKSQFGGKILHLSNNNPLTDEEIKGLPEITFIALEGKKTVYGAGDGEVIRRAVANVTIDNGLKKIQLLSSTVQGVSKFRIEGEENIVNFGDSLPISTTNNTIVIELLDSNNNALYRGTLDISTSGADRIFSIDKAPSPDNWFTFSDDTKTTVIGLTYEGKKQSDIVIPDYVTSIKSKAFYECSELTTLTVPDSVTSIGAGAFDMCTSLVSIEVSSRNKSYCDIDGVLYNKAKTYLINYPNGKTDSYYEIPNSVTCIGTSSFSGCMALTKVTIPDSVTNIESNAFAICTGLNTITIPNSVTSIGDRAFSGCTGLKTITIPNSVTRIGDCAFLATGLTTVTIPDSVRSIGVSTFGDDTELTTITIPDSVTSIDVSAFYGDTALTTITIPNSVTSIGMDAFDGCTGLNTITLSNSLTSIKEDTFSQCSGLKTITIPNSVKSIGNNAFYGCEGLTTVTIPESVTTMGFGVFFSCTGLTTVTIPSSLTSMGGIIFCHCTSLTSIKVDPGNLSFCDIDGVLYSKDKTTMLAYPEKRPDNSYIVPDSVSSIGESAFSDTENLETITIPKSVTSIADNEFDSCWRLSSITVSPDNLKYCDMDGVLINKDKTNLIKYPIEKNGETYVIPDTVTSIGDNAFNACSYLETITLPELLTSIGTNAFAGSQLKTVKCTQEQWDKFKNQFPSDSVREEP